MRPAGGRRVGEVRRDARAVRHRGGCIEWFVARKECAWRLSDAPIPTFPRKRGKGLRARWRAWLWMPPIPTFPRKQGKELRAYARLRMPPEPLPLRSGGRLGGGRRAVAKRGAGCDYPHAPIPAFPRKRGKGFCARWRARLWMPPIPAFPRKRGKELRAYARLWMPPETPPPAQRGEVGRGASGGSEARCWLRLSACPHPSLPPQAGEGVSCALARAALDAHPSLPPQAGEGASCRPTSRPGPCRVAPRVVARASVAAPPVARDALPR
jgi:hypothetical protein